jgi:hypothetical protein
MNALLRYLKGDAEKIRQRQLREIGAEILELEAELEELYFRRDKLRADGIPVGPGTQAPTMTAFTACVEDPIASYYPSFSRACPNCGEFWDQTKCHLAHATACIVCGRDLAAVVGP